MSASQLKAVATGEVTKRPTNFPAMLEAYKGEIARALPAHLKPDVMARIALTSFRMNPKLAECQPASVFAAVIQASQLGLRPGLLGECFLIPYKDQCTLQLGYQGLLELVRRSGLVDSIEAHLVHEKDTYNVHFGTDSGVTHEPYLDGDPGAVKFGYAVAKIKGGGKHVEVMTLREIQAIRDRSQNVINAKRFGKKTPWDTDFEEMARKTLMRRICKYLPKSNELATALMLDDAAYRGTQSLNVDDAIAGAFVPPMLEMETADTAVSETIDQSTGEVTHATTDAQPNEAKPAGAPVFTFAQVSQAFIDAKDIDALNDAALMIDGVGNRQHQKELDAAFAKRKQEIEFEAN